MDPVALNKMVEKAKADASATGASKKASPKEAPLKSSNAGNPDSLLDTPDEVVDRLSQEIMDAAREEHETETTKKQAELERGRHVKIAKLLAAMDVFAGASR